jgi:hypothetical protein
MPHGRTGPQAGTASHPGTHVARTFLSHRTAARTSHCAGQRNNHPGVPRARRPADQIAAITADMVRRVWRSPSLIVTPRATGMPPGPSTPRGPALPSASRRRLSGAVAPPSNGQIAVDSVRALCGRSVRLGGMAVRKVCIDQDGSSARGSHQDVDGIAGLPAGRDQGTGLGWGEVACPAPDVPGRPGWQAALQGRF